MDSAKKDIVKKVIRDLHAGLPVEEAKERILREVGPLSSADVTGIEQSLVDEGVSPEEIKSFCNVHALLFEASLAQALVPEGSPSHPLAILGSENRRIEKILEALDASLRAGGFEQAAAGLKSALQELSGVDRHYALKENAIFPFLEKHGFTGPSQVMWAKHDEVRKLFRSARAGLSTVTDAAGLAALRRSAIDPLVEEVRGMIFKEEKILFPACREKLEPEEWVRVLESFRQIGPAYAALSGLEAPLAELAGLRREAAEASRAPSQAAKPAQEDPAAGPSAVKLATGVLSREELQAMLNALPVDISFVDAADKVRYFNQPGERIFPRSVSVIGRSVQNCHPPQSVHKVNAILESFRRGERDRAEFWITMKGRFLSIRYFAVRGPAGEYLGCLEATQDLTELRGLQGERRLLDDKA